MPLFNWSAPKNGLYFVSQKNSRSRFFLLLFLFNAPKNIPNSLIFHKNVPRAMKALTTGCMTGWMGAWHSHVSGSPRAELSIVELPKWVRATLSNDEHSSDDELLEYFMQEGEIDQDTAKRYVSYRDLYLRHIVLDDGTIYKPAR
jgi:hypothetical protein